jgi:ABC-type amino acid transport substrate-binding protein
VANWADAIAKGMTVRGWASSHDIAALAASVGRQLPDDYVDFVQTADGAEGWVGGDYVALWQIHEIVATNDDLEVATYAPGLLLIGTDGGGEAFAFDLDTPTLPVVMVPIVGLSRDLMRYVGESFSAWLRSRPEAPPGAARVDRLMGKNVYEINPVILGGDPTDPSNKAIVTRDELIRIAKWWNPQIAEARRRSTE